MGPAILGRGQPSGCPATRSRTVGGGSPPKDRGVSGRIAKRLDGRGRLWVAGAGVDPTTPTRVASRPATAASTTGEARGVAPHSTGAGSDRVRSSWCSRPRPRERSASPTGMRWTRPGACGCATAWVPHGIGWSFRVWAAEDHPREAIHGVLAHGIGNGVEVASGAGCGAAYAGAQRHGLGGRHGRLRALTPSGRFGRGVVGTERWRGGTAGSWITMCRSSCRLCRRRSRSSSRLGVHWQVELGWREVARWRARGGRAAFGGGAEGSKRRMGWGRRGGSAAGWDSDGMQSAGAWDQEENGVGEGKAGRRGGSWLTWRSPAKAPCWPPAPAS